MATFLAIVLSFILNIPQKSIVHVLFRLPVFINSPGEPIHIFFAYRLLLSGILQARSVFTACS